MGPDGRGGLSTPAVRSVSTDGYGLTVEIAAPEDQFLRKFMGVRLQRRYPSLDWQVELHGGNTNNGDMHRYVVARAVYDDGIKVAELLLRMVADVSGEFDGYADEDLRGVVQGFADYELVAFLLASGAESFAYMRGQEPEPGAPPELYGLDRLRARVVEVVRAGGS